VHKFFSLDALEDTISDKMTILKFCHLLEANALLRGEEKEAFGAAKGYYGIMSSGRLSRKKICYRSSLHASCALKSGITTVVPGNSITSLRVNK